MQNLSKPSAEKTVLRGMLGECCSRKVLIGFAPASLLCGLSFADVLNEDTGEGYQRRFLPKHSQDFRRYLQTEGSATIPLTFNLRPESQENWSIQESESGLANLTIASGAGGNKVLAQVDCQHRLGSISDLEISLPFMTFIGLSLRDEMQVFNIINGKAIGLSSSLLDYHETRLASDLATQKPELYIALRLNDETDSPWYRQLDLGGKRTMGMARKASLRTMQKAVKRFLTTSRVLNRYAPEDAYEVILHFWKAVAGLLERQWQEPRKHLLTKGVGVYALMTLAGTIYSEIPDHALAPTEQEFRERLSPFITRVDWSHKGNLKGFGGESGAQEAFRFLDQIRKQTPQLSKTNG
jgi:DNA sulfur modification protein DndB